MRTKLKITEGIFPMPVLMVATYNEDGSVNVMNAAWGTMQERDTVALNLTETHKTVQNIKARGAFTVSIADAAHMVEADYFGRCVWRERSSFWPASSSLCLRPALRLSIRMQLRLLWCGATSAS